MGNLKNKKKHQLISIDFIIQEKVLFNCLRNIRQEIKILTSNQMFQRLPIAFAQLKAGDTLDNLLKK